MTERSTEERLARLEGVYEHLATKADLATIQVEIASVRADIAAVETRLLRWLVPTALAGMGIAVALARLVD